ncbi:hypothetical protein H2203_005114 [Taxawa tesnikishii (nom. ined.)]|nr:hypothetical protein H2203_005114 [Dothideales sp. JES 119]
MHKDVFTAFDTTMNYLTSYMTRNVRMNTPNSWYNTNTGDIVNFDYKYHVRWIWMLLPAALVALTFIFLVTTIVRSRGQEKWKASSLAMLYNSIDEQHRIDFGPSAGITDLHRAAEKRQFTLVPRTHKKDYRLVGQEEHGVVYERHAGS